MKLLITVLTTLLLSGCGNLIKSGAIVEAQNALDRSHYAEALENTTIAESFGNLSDSEKAKLHYLRALSLEGLQRDSEAAQSYEYVIDSHSSSAYEAAARQRLEALRLRERH